MIGALRHRGPDGFGYYLGEGVGLAHARLAIVDIEHGAQPISNESEDVVVVFNGEIFDFADIRAELVAKGHVFRTRTDTEVLVHLYEEYGESFVERLNGQFAFALWDARRRRLLLCRDQMGIAPLYYTIHEGRLYFASEVKALFAAVGRPRRLDALALDEVLTFWAPRAPRTPFEGVSQLEPGQRLVVEGGALCAARYFRLAYPGRGEHAIQHSGEAEERVRDALRRSTERRLSGDLPVAAYLSGGLDSAIIATLLAQTTRSAPRTFSIGFADALYDERGYQDHMAAYLGAKHERVVFDEHDAADSFERALWHCECPLVRSAALPMLRLSETVARAGYRVVLTGEGADELFAGYDLFKELKIRRFWARQPGSRMRPRLLGRLYPYLARSPGKARAYAEAFFGIGLDAPDAPLFSHLTRAASTARAKNLFSRELAAQLPEDPLAEAAASLPVGFSRWDPLNRAQYLETEWLLPGYLLASQGDRMLMANSVEGRYPFLDPEVIGLSTQIAPRLHLRGLDEKSVLKRAFKASLPGAITSRSKQPYRAPGLDAAQRVGTTSELFRELLEERTLTEYGYFDPQKVALLVRKANGAPLSESDSMAFTVVLTTQYLHHRFVASARDLPFDTSSSLNNPSNTRSSRVAA